MRLVFLLTSVLLLAGCQSQWFLVTQRNDLVTTDLLVRTEPTGAPVSFNGVEMERAPFRLPVEYDHEEKLYERQTNVGAQLREDWGTVGTIIGFPIWGPASAFHRTEERRVHVYGRNRHVISASLGGYDEAWQELVLEGEDEIEVSLELKRSESRKRAAR